MVKPVLPSSLQYSQRIVIQPYNKTVYINYFRWLVRPRTISTQMTSSALTSPRTPGGQTGALVPTPRHPSTRACRRCTSGATSSSRSSCRRSTRRRRRNPSQRNMWLPWFRWTTSSLKKYWIKKLWFEIWEKIGQNNEIWKSRRLNRLVRRIGSKILWQWKKK